VREGVPHRCLDFLAPRNRTFLGPELNIPATLLMASSQYPPHLNPLISAAPSQVPSTSFFVSGGKHGESSW
jgi:hypothetical protein